MKSVKLLGALALAAIILPGAASAQGFFDGAKPYVRVDGGWVTSAGGDRSFDYSSLLTNGSGKGLGNVEDGWLAGIGAGFALPNGIRADVQFTYRDGLEAKSSTGNVTIPGAGFSYSGTNKADITSFAMMFNGYYDIKLGSIITPYLGAGIGFSSNKARDMSFSLTNNATGLSDSGVQRGRRTTSFAWSLMAGASIEVMKNLSFDIGYRYFDGGRVKSLKEFSLGAGAVIGSTDPLSQDIRLHEITAGLRYSF